MNDCPRSEGSRLDQRTVDLGARRIGSGDATETKGHIIRKLKPITRLPKCVGKVILYPENFAQREHWIGRDARNLEQSFVTNLFAYPNRRVDWGIAFRPHSVSR